MCDRCGIHPWNTESTTGTSMLAAPERTRNHIAKTALQQTDKDTDVAPQRADEGIATQRTDDATPQRTRDAASLHEDEHDEQAAMPSDKDVPSYSVENAVAQRADTAPQNTDEDANEPGHRPYPHGETTTLLLQPTPPISVNTDYKAQHCQRSQTPEMSPTLTHTDATE